MAKMSDEDLKRREQMSHLGQKRGKGVKELLKVVDEIDPDGDFSLALIERFGPEYAGESARRVSEMNRKSRETDPTGEISRCAAVRFFDKHKHEYDDSF